MRASFSVDVVVRIEIVDADDVGAARRAARRDVHADEAGRTGDEDVAAPASARIRASRAARSSARSLAYLQEARERSRWRCARSRQRRRENRASTRRSARSARAATPTMRERRAALAARVQRLGLQRRVAVLLGDVSSIDSADACSRSPSSRADAAVGDAPARAPDRRSSARGAGRTGASSSRDSPRRARASGRGSGCAAPCAYAAMRRRAAREQRAPIDSRKLGREPLVGVEAQHPVVRASCDGELLLRPEAAPRLRRPRARRSGARFLRYDRRCLNRRRALRRERRRQQALGDVAPRHRA